VTGSDVSHVIGSDVTGLYVTFLPHFFRYFLVFFKKNIYGKKNQKERRKKYGEKVRKKKVQEEKSTGKKYMKK
jgi:hypothetical protein